MVDIRGLQASENTFADGGWFPYFNQDLSSYKCMERWVYRNSSGDFQVNSACVSLQELEPFGLTRDINRSDEFLNQDTDKTQWCATASVYEPAPSGTNKSVRKQWGFCLRRDDKQAVADGGLQDTPTPCVSKWRYKFADKRERILVEPCVSFTDLQPYGFNDDAVDLKPATLSGTDTTRWCSTSITYNIVNEVNRTKWGYCSPSASFSNSTQPPTSSPPASPTATPTASQATPAPGSTPAPTVVTTAAPTVVATAAPSIATASPSQGSSSTAPTMQSPNENVTYYADGGGQSTPVACAKRWEFKKENKEKVLMETTCISFDEYQPYGFDDPEIRKPPTLELTDTTRWCSTLPIHNPFNLINRTSWGYCASSNSDAPTMLPTAAPSSSIPTQTPTVSPTSPTASPSAFPSAAPSEFTSDVPTASPVTPTSSPHVDANSTSPSSSPSVPPAVAPTAMPVSSQFIADMEEAFQLESFSSDGADVHIPSWLTDEGVVSGNWEAQDAQLRLSLDSACTTATTSSIEASFATQYPDYAFDAACVASSRRRLQAGSEAVVKLCAAEPCEANAASTSGSGNTAEEPDITLIVVIAVAAVLLVAVLGFAVNRWRRSRDREANKRRSQRGLGLGPALSMGYKVERTKDAIHVELPESLVPKQPKQTRPNVQIDFDKLNVEQAQLVASQPFFADLHKEEQQKTLEVIEKHKSRLEAQQKKASKRELVKPKSSKLVQQMESKSKLNGGSKYIKRTCATCTATYYSVSGKSILCLNCRTNRIPPKSAQQPSVNGNGKAPHQLHHAKSTMSPPKRQSSDRQQQNGSATVGHFFGNGDSPF